jgi:predicted nucleotidyltransferase
MNEKKPESLADNLSTTRKYQANPLNVPGKEVIDFEKIKTKLDDFKKKLVKKFPFVIALGILPPNSFAMFEEDEGLTKEEIERKPVHLIMIMPEEQYKNLTKIKADVIALIKESGENLWVHIKTSEVDLWNYGLDSKFEFLDAVSASFPLHDNGFLGALRVSTIHKNLVLNWLNVGRVRYVASYIICGSLVRGTAVETSDIDTAIIIDDTDVKRMSRVELLEKLRGRITYEFVKEATALAGVKNALSPQVWLLTDFWQRVKDAEPVAFTFIRDGIPMYDRGTFIPWKRLLQMGKIKPSPEAIDLYMKEGERTDELVKRRLMDAMVDVYYGVLTPTQALMMMAGHGPPIPKVIVEEVKKVLVDKEKVLGEKELKTLEKAVKYFKDYEHGKLKEISGKEIDTLMEECKAYNKKMKEIREKLEKKMQEYQTEKTHEEFLALMKKIFGDKSQEELIKSFENEMVKKGKISERLLPIVKEVMKMKVKTKNKTLTQSEMQKISRDASEVMDALTEYSQRKELISMEKGIAKITHEKGWAEVLSTDEGFFVIEQDEKIEKIENGKIVDADKKQLESALKETKERLKFEMSSEVISILEKKFGKLRISF